MKYSEAKAGRVFVIRLEDGEILHESLERFGREQNVHAASVLVLYRRVKSAKADVKARAEMQQKRQAAGELPKGYPNPIQVVRIGDEFVLAAIGQEVVVDYALRLKQELRAIPAVWIAGYSNDVAGYLGSRRVLNEGGYEGGGANVMVGHPAPYAPAVEDDVVAEVHRLVMQLGR